MTKIRLIYDELLSLYGHQGWWPLIEHGYHLKQYNFPTTNQQKFEICIGAILTQNVSWTNVEKALINLKKLNALTVKGLDKLEEEELKTAIKPAGYYNQKTNRLKTFSKFFINLGNRVPTRDELLSINGIGPETADSMLLYSFKVPSFIVDAYTKRIFLQLKLIKETESYDAIKSFIETNLNPDVKIYQEYHALIVAHAKKYYQKKYDQTLCPLYQKISQKIAK
tara:strand:+ start:1371 stop:2042 length:672 start_codon:yes stop_codon:yes gene_type:complete